MSNDQQKQQQQHENMDHALTPEQYEEYQKFLRKKERDRVLAREYMRQRRAVDKDTLNARNREWYHRKKAAEKAKEAAEANSAEANKQSD